MADWLRRAGRLAEARQRYAAIAAGPDPYAAALALRGAAAVALDTHDWAAAEAFAARLAVDPPGELDGISRGDLLAAAARGRRRARLALVAWLGLGLAIAGLAGSLAEATLRRPGRPRGWSALAPPAEILFLAPIAGVLVTIAFTAHHAIAPAVLEISLAGVALAWLSGATLDRLRATTRPFRARAIAHVAACALGVLAAGYLAMTRDGLVELLAETVRFGPG